ncbi:MAG: ParB N-terminal domain-containing protein [Candidatus Paceibacterota bacterium]|jgi:hypothetical protein
MNNIKLVNPFELKAHEKTRFTHVLLVFAKIIFRGKLKNRLLIDEKTKTILNGHHRCWTAKKIGLKRVPCYCVDYLNDESIKVYPRRSNIPVNKSIVINMALSGKVFPYKTTHHKYTTPKFDGISLYQLWIK